MAMGPPEILLVLAVLLLLFGGKRLPGLARSMGSSIKEFRKGAEAAGEPTDTESASTPDGADDGRA